MWILFFLFFIAVLVILWIVSRKTYIVVRTTGAGLLSTATSAGERGEAEAMYSAIQREAIKVRHRALHPAAVGQAPGFGSSPNIPQPGRFVP